MCAQTIQQVKGLSDAVLNHDVQEFAKRAKEVAVLLSKVFDSRFGFVQLKKQKLTGDQTCAEQKVVGNRRGAAERRSESDFSW